MVGRFIIDVVGTSLSKQEQELLLHPQVGAIILFAHNYIDPLHLKDFAASIQAINPDIFISVDQEGGFVQRFKNGFTALPSLRLYGEAYNINCEFAFKLVESYTAAMAQELLDHGVDLSFTPVLDIHGCSEIIAKKDRSFHADPKVVIELAKVFIKTMQQEGMPSVGKHFPGHGSIPMDSHLSIVKNNSTFEDLKQLDLLPFTKLIEDNKLDAIMPAHIIFPEIDANNSAGFSSIWLQQILRQQLKFQNLIISDCLSMAGADIGDIKKRCLKALEAGCDMLILCKQPRKKLMNLFESMMPVSKASTQRIITFKSKMRRFNVLT